MAIHAPQLFLLAYDIADPRRLVRVHRTVKQQGMPLQYSVFLIIATPAVLDGLLAELDDIIDPRADDIRVYPLPTRLDAEGYGRQFLPAGVMLLGDDRLDHRLAALLAHEPAPAAVGSGTPQACGPGPARRHVSG
jgi:CRISPR-associated protein Cas2